MLAKFLLNSLRPLPITVWAMSADAGSSATEHHQNYNRTHQQAKPFWNRTRILVAAILAVAALGFGLYWMQTPAAPVDENELTISVVSGRQTAGGFITIRITHQGIPVADALITLNTYQQAGLTDGDGYISINLPEENQVVIEATKGELNGELVIDLG